MTQHEPLFDVAGKVVVVTGASRGIGLGIAEGFVRAGASVYICARKVAECEAAAVALSAYGQCFAIPADLGNVEGIQDFAHRFGERETRLDVLVNNAGNIWVESLEGYPESGWDKVFGLNVKGVFFLIQSMLPLLRTAARPDNPARVINIGSIDAFHVPSHETYAYTASKAAVHQLSKHLALHLAPSHITVNVIAPGRYRSRLLENAIELESVEDMLAPIPLNRFADGPDLAGAAIYLASRAGSFVTGAVLPVDGGHATTL
jgi:NAD(P)-dependent dehydrogenase (short-subunit alcohol dehydrogenase family)